MSGLPALDISVITIGMFLIILQWYECKQMITLQRLVFVVMNSDSLSTCYVLQYVNAARELRCVWL